MLVGYLISKAYRMSSVCLFIFLFLSATAHGEDQGKAGHVDCLIESAHNLHLADERLWRILLHYPEGASASLIDDPAFFISKDGKFSPESELAATLKGMFASAPLNDNHTLCRYPARSEWLQQQLAIDTSRLPKPDCAGLNTYLATVNPQSASLMFPAAYMNSPASMFGHTYLRIDSDYRSELLSYAVNYSAKTDESNGMVYAWKGVFGLYKGYFSLLPHYAKIREYSGMEHRDIWEYRLNLTREEVRRMALHVWELRERYSDYYFFDENCSYNLLFLLDSARPTAKLTAFRTPLVVPLDTIAHVRKAGLVTSTCFRSSQGDRIRSIAAELNSDDIDRAIALSRTFHPTQPSQEPSTPERRAKVLDLAVELLQHDYDKQRISQEDYSSRLLQLLRERSRLPSPKTSSSPGDAKPVEPDQGHSSARVTIGFGADRGRGFVEAGIRPGYHSLDDPGAGYPEGAQIQFLNTLVRYYPGREHVRLQQLDLVDIVSLASYDRIFRRVSWKVTAGFTRIVNRSGNDALVWQLATGGGLATDFGDRVRLFVMPGIDMYLGDGLRDFNAVGSGVSGGLLVRPIPEVILQSRAKIAWYPFSELHNMKQVESSLTLALSRNNSLEARHTHISSAGHSKNEVALFLNHYF